MLVNQKVTNKPDKREVIHELWRRGDLDYKLHSVQRKVKNDLKNAKKRTNTVLMSRRIGKTYLLMCMAIEICLKKKFAIIKYLCPEQRQGQRNLEEIMRVLLGDCPTEFKPEWYENKKEWIFPNGSKIQVAGTDSGNAESLRGGSSDMCIVDEAGFADDLTYNVRSILFPTTKTTKGKIYLISTPSKVPGHEFMLNYVTPALNSGELSIYTINDDPLLTDEDRKEILAEFPSGVDDPDYQREYLCVVTANVESLAVPEFTKETESRCVLEVSPPPFMDPYVSGDIGFKDLTIFLFGYYDFAKNKLVIVDEATFYGANEVRTDKIANVISQKETNVFKDNTDRAIDPYLRVMDNDLKLINDLRALHGISFMATRKDDKEAAINELRMMFAREQIIIHPRCKNLIYHLKTTTWDKKRKKFNRCQGTADGFLKGHHGDGVDALVYLVRNINKSRNPYPKDYNCLKGPNAFNSLKKKNEDNLSKAVKSIMNFKKKP